LDLALIAAFRLKAAREDCRILIVTKDIRARGAMEELQRKAQMAGVHFIRSEDEPRLGKMSSPEITVTDQVLGPLSFKADLIVDLRSGRNEASARACAILGIATRPDGTPKEAKCRLVSGESLKAGVFVLDAWTEWCADDVLLDARAVAGRASSLLRSEIEEGGPIAQVEEGKCSACLTCVRICPYGAPRMNEEMKAEIKFELCQGCGMCVTACPSKAIDMHLYSDGQLAAEARAALGGKG
jgi:heterodisulfide reductase subunit A